MQRDLHFVPALEETYHILSALDYDTLPISDYNKTYISRLLPSLRYFLTIYMDSIERGLRNSVIPLQELTMVDFGGGSGFLSIYAKMLGIGNVIYVDINPLSVETVTLIKDISGKGPDVILQGSTAVLASWCRENLVLPDLFIATDLIEHVYNLGHFFCELIQINNGMRMVFTTASSPYNPYVKRRLHRIMQAYETGSLKMPNYYMKRKAYIEKNYPSFNERETEEWAQKTRGMIYADMDAAIKSHKKPTPTDAFNTCDPDTGNWTERIVPIRFYRDILKKYGYGVSVHTGFYNVYRSGKWKSSFFRILNFFIRISGKMGFLLSPFIILVCGRKK